MRIRSTKPEFWRSKTIARLDWDVRLVLKGLESFVDDNGVGKDDIALIAADVFPRDLSRDPRETLARLTEAISTLANEGLIVRYTVDGEDLLYVDKWADIQRVDKPNKGRFPRPDGTLEYSEPVDRDSYRKPRETLANPPETLAPVTGEQGNRGTGEISPLTLVEGGPGGDPKNLPVAAQAAPANTRGTRLPTDWRPDDEAIQEMRRRFPGIDLKTEHEKFTNYWRSQPGARGRKTDWLATWRNWVIRASEQAPRNGSSANGIGKPTQKALGYRAAAEELLAEMEQPQ